MHTILSTFFCCFSTFICCFNILYSHINLLGNFSTFFCCFSTFICCLNTILSTFFCCFSISSAVHKTFCHDSVLIIFILHSHFQHGHIPSQFSYLFQWEIFCAMLTNHSRSYFKHNHTYDILEYLSHSILIQYTQVSLSKNCTLLYEILIYKT